MNMFSVKWLEFTGWALPMLRDPILSAGRKSSFFVFFCFRLQFLKMWRLADDLYHHIIITHKRSFALIPVIRARLGNLFWTFSTFFSFDLRKSTICFTCFCREIQSTKTIFTYYSIISFSPLFFVTVLLPPPPVFFIPWNLVDYSLAIFSLSFILKEKRDRRSVCCFTFFGVNLVWTHSNHSGIQITTPTTCVQIPLIDFVHSLDGITKTWAGSKALLSWNN